MTSPSNPQLDSSDDEKFSEESPPPKPNKPWLRSLLILCLLSLSAGTAYGWYFIHYKLSPTVAEALTKLFSRPVEMGKVESFSLTSLQFGESALPPEAGKSEQVIVSAIKVDFTPLKLLLEQSIELNVTLIDPEIKIQQTPQGQWFTTQLNQQPPGFLEIKLQTLDAKNADLAVSPRNANGELLPAVNFTLPQINSQFFDNNQRILFQLENLSVKDESGSLNLEGEARLNAGEVDLSLKANQLAIGGFARLVTSPVDILEGTLDAETQINLFLDGPVPTFEGTAQLNNIKAKLDQLATPLEKTNAQIRLAEKNIIIENFTTQLGAIEGTAEGIINLSEGYNLTANVAPTPVSSLFNAFNLSSPSPVKMEGAIAANLSVKGPLDNPQINLAANSTEPTTLDQVTFRQFQTELAIQDNQVTIETFQASPQAGGEIAANGQLNLTPKQDIALDVQLKDIPGEVIRPYQSNLPSDLGTLNAQAALTGTLTDWKNLQGEGTANLRIAQGSVIVPQLELSQGRLAAKINVNNLQPEQLTKTVPPQLQNPVSGEFRLNADLADFSPDNIRLNGQGELNLPEGQLVATGITFNEGQFNANFQVNKIPLAWLAPQAGSQFNELLSAQFKIRGDVEAFNLNQIQGEGSGSVTLNNGNSSQISLQNLRLNQGNWQGDLQVREFNPSQFISKLPPQLQTILVNTNLRAQGTLDNLTPAGITVQGTAQINQLLGGSLTANVLRLENGEFEVVASPNNIELSQLSDQLEGNLAGEVAVSGNLDNLTPAGVNAQANLNFNQGLAAITNPLTTRLRWDGQQLVLEEATAENFFAEGIIALNLDQNGQDILERVNLTVEAKQLDLAQLPLPQPPAVGEMNLQGLANFSGTVQGNLKQPQAEGSIRLENFAFERFTFDSVMEGGIRANSEQGVQLDLVGNSESPDQIQVMLASPETEQFFPLTPDSFLVKRKEAIAEGTRQGNDLDVTLEKIPLDLLKDFVPLSPDFARQPASGTLEGNLTINLENYGASGELALVNPSLGRFSSDRAAANFTFLNNTLTIQQAGLIEQASKYQGRGRITFTETTPNFEANLNIQQGRIEDVLSALQLFELADLNQNFATPNYGNAEDVQVAGINVENQPLEQQLRRFSEIKALQSQLRQAQEAVTAIPSLSMAKGNFTGQLKLQGTSFNPQDIQGELSLDGAAWQWGPYQAKTVEAEATLNNGIITILPLRFASGDSFLNLSGTFGGQNQSAQLQVNEIPIALLQNIVELPEFIGVSGYVNGTATVAGTQDNPTARGELRVSEATLNQTPIETIQGSFNYNNSQLNFFAQGLLSSDSDPLTLSGDLPYQLPFAIVPPASDDLNIDITLQDDGFALLDVISNGQLTWQGGEGEVNLAINGPFNLENIQLDQLNTTGVITLSEASIGTAVIPEPLTNINSKVEFNFNQLSVQEFKADFGGGEIIAIGGLSLFNPDATSETLEVSLQNLAVDLPNLYEGDVAGEINIARTVLEPLIGGEMTVSEGEVSLTSRETPTADNASPENQSSNIRFNNLKINLGNNLRVTRQPIMNFFADGSLTVNGNLANLRPQGTITLERGQVNLGPTQFRLAPGYEQTATFLPSQGLDPRLNVRLVASVAETSGSVGGESTGVEGNKQINPTVGTLQSVQVQALVRGRASELQPGQLTANNDVLTLSSDPNRSQTEILALLGGGLTSGLGQGNTALGLANLAGSTLFGTFQNTIGDALGLSEFRIFPTLIPTETEEGDGEETGSTRSTLGFGAEAGIEISNDFSFSVLTIFNADQTFQYSLRYRLGEDILLRGTTDLSDSQSLIVEYESRF